MRKPLVAATLAAVLGLFLGLSGLAVGVPLPPSPQDIDPAYPPETMTESDFWGWVEMWAKKPSEYAKVCGEQCKKYKEVGKEKQNYGVRVFNAIWEHMRDAERMNDAEKLAKHKAETEVLALGLQEGLGLSEPHERWKTFFALPTEKRNDLEWAKGRYEAAKQTIEHEKDYNSALERYKVGLAKVREIGIKDWVVKFLLAMAECYVVLKNTPEANKCIEEALAIAKEIGAADLQKETEEAMKKLKESGVALEESPFQKYAENYEKDDKTKKDKWVAYALLPGPKTDKLPVRTPHPPLRENTFFWKQLYLEDPKSGDKAGKPAAVKLPIPGDQWLVKGIGEHEITMTTDPSKKGEKFKAGFSPSLQEVLATYDPVRPGVPNQLKFYFQIVNPNQVLIFNAKRSINNPPNMLDLRVRCTSYREGRGPGGQRIILTDGNFNGHYGTSWSGANDDSVDILKDGFCAGGGNLGTYFSPLVRVGKDFYLCQPSKTSLSVEFLKYTGPKGKVRVRNQGLKGKFLWLVVKTAFQFKREKAGGGSIDESVYGAVDIADAQGGEVELPVGDWLLHNGLLTDGGNDEERATRLQMDNEWTGQAYKYPPIKVVKGQTTEIALGGTIEPKVEVVFDEVSKEIRVHTETIRFYGTKGEKYWECWPEPVQYDFQVFDSKNQLVDNAKARKFGEKDPLPAHKDLGFAKPVIIKWKPMWTAPYRVNITKLEHPLFAAVLRSAPPGAAEPPKEAPKDTGKDADGKKDGKEEKK